MKSGAAIRAGMQLKALLPGCISQPTIGTDEQFTIRLPLAPGECRGELQGVGRTESMNTEQMNRASADVVAWCDFVCAGANTRESFHSATGLVPLKMFLSNHPRERRMAFHRRDPPHYRVTIIVESSRERRRPRLRKNQWNQ